MVVPLSFPSELLPSPRVLTPSLSKLSSCAMQCVLGSVKAVPNCSNPLDPKCICDERFVNAATDCLIAKCDHKDAVPALDIAKQMCPDLGLPDLSKLGDCAFECVISTLTGAHCKGPLDKQCICGIPFGLKAAGCLALKCALDGAGEAINLEFGICRPLDKPGCAATGIWALTDLRCLLPGLFKKGDNQKREVRYATPAALYHRALLEAEANA